MKHIDELIEHYPQLGSCIGDIRAAAELMTGCYEHGGKLLICGNGGSAADSMHIVGELEKGFRRPRALDAAMRASMKKNCTEMTDELLDKLQMGLPAIALTGASPLMTAVANDNSPDMIFAQQVLALGNIGDILLCISTSGNAVNVYNAALTARSIGMFVLALTGGNGGRLKAAADISVIVPEKETYRVQELHLPVYHALCSQVEEYFFS